MRFSKDKATRHTLQYAGSAEDVRRIKELAERFAARKKIHNRYKLKDVSAEMVYLNEAKTEASIAFTWQFEDDTKSWSFIKSLYKYLQLRMSGSAEGGFSPYDNPRSYVPMPILAEPD
jgi:hypothetical protein|tara:strand:+ start:7017 stop:7370 length:354 start_codon:yes stop_codon:yes gene_type:complete